MKRERRKEDEKGGTKVVEVEKDWAMVRRRTRQKRQQESEKRCDIFTCTFRVMCYCVITAPPYTSGVPLSLEQTVFPH